jgi:hypothetical protein
MRHINIVREMRVSANSDFGKTAAIAPLINASVQVAKRDKGKTPPSKRDDSTD